MPLTVAHVFTSPLPDGSDTQLVKPSNWNQTHAVTYTPTGEEIIGAFSNGGNVSFGTNPSGFVTASAPSGGAGDGGNIIAAAGSTANSTATVLFSNANGVSFGLNGATMTASVAAAGGAQTGISGISAGSQLQTVGTLAFVNSNGISFGMSNSSQITASYTVPNVPAQTQQPVYFSASNSNTSAGTLQFGNTNGVSFSVSNGSLVATVKTDYLTTAANSTHSHGNPTLALTNINGTTASASNGLTLSLSAVVPAQTAQPVAVSGSNGSFNFSTLSLGASNGLSFYTTNGSVVGSYTVPTVPGATVFSNSNNVSFGLNGSTVTATATFSQSNQTGNLYVAGNSTQLSSTAGVDLRSISFEGAGVASVGVSAGRVLISVPSGGGAGDGYNVIGVNGAGTQLSTTLQLNNANNVSFGLNLGTITASASYPAQTVDTNKAGTGFTSTSTGGVAIVGTNNTNGLSLGIPNYLTTAQPVGAYLTTARASNDGVGLNTALTANGVAWTVNSSGISLNVPAFLTTGANSTHSHGNPTLALTNLTGTTASASNGLTLSLSGNAAQTTQTQPSGNIAGVGTTFAGTNVSASMTFNSNGLNMALSAPTPGGGGAINVSAGTTSGNLQTIQFNNGNGVSFGLNGSTVTASVNAGGGASATHTLWFPYNEAVNVVGQIGQGTLHFAPVPTPDIGEAVVSFDRLCFPIYHSNSTNSTGSATISFWFGLYSRENTTGTRISLAHSTSATTAYTYSGNGSTAIIAGVRLLTIPWTSSVSGGRYIAGVLSRTTTGGNNCSISQVQISNLASNFSGVFGVSNSASSNQWPLGWGLYSASTSGLPNSVAYSQIYGTNSIAKRNPEWFLINGTA